MKDYYKEILVEVDDISECAAIESAMFTYGFIWGRAAFARELQLISDDQMAHIHKVADEAIEDWKTFFL